MPPVVWMMTDGMRPDALAQVNTPNLDQLFASSAYTMTAQSVMPCVTICCHTSMFYSASPERHGVRNVGDISNVKSNGLIEQLKAAGKTSAFFYNWDPLRAMSRPLTLTASYMKNIVAEYVDGRWIGDDFIVEQACREIPQQRFDLSFVYIGTMDECGHKFGWMSDEYLRQIEIVDGFIGEILAALPEDMTILLHSDHGGHDHKHGDDIPEDMNVPFLLTGSGIKQNYEIQAPVTLLDIAPTLARILEIDPAPEWEGKVIEEIFEA